MADIEIRGAGPVGCVLALLLAGHGKPAVLIGRADEDKREKTFRPLALSDASRLILERVGAWQSLAPAPIERIHVSQQGAFGRAHLSAEEAGVPALGYVVGHSELLEVLLSRVKEEAIPMENRGEASLLVHAEGFSEDAKETSYPHDAVVARIGAEPGPSGTAWERFTPEGPLALLPLGRDYGLVWAMSRSRARALSQAPAEEFLAALQESFGARAGRFTEVSGRAQVPLALRVRASRVAPRAAYVGNSAQALHPVAGQGLNLGLRDAWDLAQVLRDAADPGDERVLARYARMRRLDAAATVRATDFLARGFLGTSRARRWIRGIGLTALDTCPPARRFFARRMIYGASALP